MKNIYKENDILYRKDNDAIVFKSNVENASSVLELIYDYEKYRDAMLHFKSGISADWVRDQSVSGELSKNVFGIYNTVMYDILLEIKKMLTDACKTYDINIEKNRYYISSEHVLGVRKDAWYDFGGIRIPCFSGMVILDGENQEISVGKEVVGLKVGDIVLFESGHKITYSSESFNMISFNIAPLSLLQGQYPQKWIPILGAIC
jgi:hypothetical protein